MAVERRPPVRGERIPVTVERLNALMRDTIPGYGRLVPQVDASFADFPVDPLNEINTADAVAARIEETPS